jgi:hypothetical protein
MGTESSVLILGFSLPPSNAVTPLRDYESHDIDYSAASPTDSTETFTAEDERAEGFHHFADNS